MTAPDTTPPAGPEEPAAFSWGPERRAPSSAADMVTAVVIVALLAGGIVGLAIHKDTKDTKDTSAIAPAPTARAAPSTTTTTIAVATVPPSTPGGFVRLLDPTDHLTLAVPPGWQAPAVTNNSVASALQAMKAKNPTLAPLLDNALGAMSSIQIGVFAVDVASRTTLYTYGMDVPGVTSADQLSTADVVKQVQAVGGKNVQVNIVHLPIAGAGPVAAGQVSAQLVVNKVTIAEALDYFVIKARLISIVVSTRGTTAPLGVLHQIESTLAAN